MSEPGEPAPGTGRWFNKRTGERGGGAGYIGMLHAVCAKRTRSSAHGPAREARTLRRQGERDRLSEEIGHLELMVSTGRQDLKDTKEWVTGDILGSVCHVLFYLYIYIYIYTGLACLFTGALAPGDCSLGGPCGRSGERALKGQRVVGSTVG